jgi:hypothetical protein
LKTMDFVSFYGTGRLIRAGEYEKIYDFESEAVVQRQVFGADKKTILIFAHPPHITPLLAVIASEDYILAYIYWTALRLCFAFVCVELIRRYLLRSGWAVHSALLGALGCGTFFPVFISLLGGQDTIFTLLGLLIWMFALLKGEEMVSGLGLAFATLSPTAAGALALPLFVSRNRASLWFMVGLLGLAVYSFLLVGTKGIIDFLYLLNLNSLGVGYGINWSSMYNLLGLLVRAFPNLNIETARNITWTVAALSILVLCFFWWNKKENLSIQHIAIAVVLSTISSPHLHLHALSILLLPFLGIITILYERGNKPIAITLIPAISTALVILIFFFPVWNFTAFYLLMFALLFYLVVVKPVSG